MTTFADESQINRPESTWSLHDPLKYRSKTPLFGVMTPFLKGHADSRQLILGKSSDLGRLAPHSFISQMGFPLSMLLRGGTATQLRALKRRMVEEEWRPN